MIRASLEAIEVQVLPLIDTGSAEGSQQGEITVNIFEDVAVSTASHEPMTNAAWATAASPGLFSTGGMALLIVAALGMMFLMVRRVGQNVSASPDSTAVVEPTLLVDDVDVLGEVDDTDVVLDGVEINNDEVRRKVMLDQIREAVQAHPEESASVLRRWTRTET
jgi:flagellar biosynthesis/type III secretory pathway M-ring protein FliF/YscJ